MKLKYYFVNIYLDILLLLLTLLLLNIYMITHIYIHTYTYIILSRINRATMNLLLKISRFFHSLQVNVLLAKYFSISCFGKLCCLQTSGNRRIFFKYYY